MDIETGIAAYLESKKKSYPRHVNRISDIGHPCERYLYYARKDWDKTPPISNSLQGIFSTGNVLEAEIEKIVIDVGRMSDPQWRIVGSQMPTKDALLNKYNISGTIDGMLQVHNGDTWDTRGVIDIKTSNPNIFNNLSDLESLSQYPWTKKYIAQLMMYSFAHDMDKCYILFVNKSNLFEMKLIEFDLDLEYVEELLQKAGRINDAIELEMPPEKINIPSECSRCNFNSLCCPELELGEDVNLSTDSELEEWLDEMNELKPSKARYDALDRKLKDRLVKGTTVVCGNHLITWSLSEGTREAKPAYEYKTWTKKIQCVIPKES